jgi:hypothetical protein
MLAIVPRTATADEITTAIQITAGTVEVSRDPIQPTASFHLVGSSDFELTGSGVSLVPGGCDPCAGGDPAGLPGGVFAHNGHVSFGNTSGEFDLLVGGGGSLDFTAAGFNLPLDATEPVVFSTPFTMSGSIALGPEPLGGSLASAMFALSGSGTGTATFLPGTVIPGLGREFFFDHAVFAFENQVTPEPATLLLIVIPAVLSARVRRAGATSDCRGSRFCPIPR